MKKWFALLGFVSILSIGGAAFASGLDVADCARMPHPTGGSCVSMCATAPGMTHGVSDCATSADCPMMK